MCLCRLKGFQSRFSHRKVGANFVQHLNLKMTKPNCGYRNVCMKNVLRSKSDITCLITSRETFTYNTHNSAQAKLTAAVELQIIVTTNYATVAKTEKQSNMIQ